MIRKLVLSVAVLLCSFPLLAAEKALPVDAMAGSSVIAKDPVTGEFRAPNAIEMKNLSEQISIMFKRPTTPAKVVAHSDGMLSAVLDDSYQNVLMITRTPDGDEVHACVTGMEAALHLMEFTAAQYKAPVAEEK